MAYDLNGQLQIRWEWAAEPIRSAVAGTLEITDGARVDVRQAVSAQLSAISQSIAVAGC